MAKTSLDWMIRLLVICALSEIVLSRKGADDDDDDDDVSSTTVAPAPVPRTCPVNPVVVSTYTIGTVTNTFDRSTGIGASFSTQAFYYVGDWSRNVLAAYDECGVQTKAINFVYPQHVEVFNNNLYVASNNQYIKKLDLNFVELSSINVAAFTSLHASTFFNRLFAPILGTLTIKGYDANLVEVSSWPVTSVIQALTSFNQFVYATTHVTISVLDGNNNGAVIRSFPTSCGTSGGTFGIAADSTGSFLYVSCYAAKKVNKINAIDGTPTGISYNTVGAPMDLVFNQFGQLVVATQAPSPGFIVINV